jgi:hypothetical protein
MFDVEPNLEFGEKLSQPSAGGAFQSAQGGLPLISASASYVRSAEFEAVGGL